jgi:7,8-dihydropterin-6-yl-methyl-4-(beta-D-ribofuranosyl)aminobenzene 5'-phosphate synthase
MTTQGIDPSGIHEIFISHGHWDHTNGLSLFTERKDIRLYLPAPLRAEGFKGEVISVEGPLDLGGPFFSTGVLAGIEQSLVVREGACNTLITGCSHPGVRAILDRASELTRITALVGGLHDFNDFEILKDLDIVCATHCTFQIDRIQALFPEKTVPGGVGTVIRIPDPGRRPVTGDENDAARRP